MRFTDQNVRALPHPERGQKEYSDDAIPGLAIVVGKRTKTFTLVTGTGKNRKRHTLGRYDPPHFTLAMAREKARDIIAHERIEQTQTPRTTFKEAFDLYERMHLSQLRKSTARNVKHVLTVSFSKFSAMPLADIKRPDIAPILDTMLDRPPTMLSAFRFLRTFLNWCVERGYIEHAATDRMKPPKSPPSRERVLAAEELVAIWRACPDSDYGRLVKLLILSGQRRDQWGSLQREYIRADIITWPAAVMKMGKTHTLPLTPAMKALLPDRIGCSFPTRTVSASITGHAQRSDLTKGAASQNGACTISVEHGQRCARTSLASNHITSSRYWLMPSAVR